MKFKERFGDFLSNYFGENYDGRHFKIWEDVIFEIEIYFKDGYFGGWSSYYCRLCRNDSTLENDADLKIFYLLLEIDIQNGAATSRIVISLCLSCAFEAVKVRLIHWK